MSVKKKEREKKEKKVKKKKGKKRKERGGKKISLLTGVLNTANHVVVLKLQKMNPPRPTLTKCAECGQMRYDNKYKL